MCRDLDAVRYLLDNGLDPHSLWGQRQQFSTSVQDQIRNGYVTVRMERRYSNAF